MVTERKLTLFGIDLDYPEAIRTTEVVLTKSAVIVLMRPGPISSDWKLSLGSLCRLTRPFPQAQGTRNTIIL